MNENNKKSSKRHPSTNMRCLLICCVWFSLNMALCFMIKPLGLTCPEDIAPKVWWFVHLGVNLEHPLLRRLATVLNLELCFCNWA